MKRKSHVEFQPSAGVKISTCDDRISLCRVMKRKSALAIDACVQEAERENELHQSFSETYGQL